MSHVVCLARHCLLPLPLSPIPSLAILYGRASIDMFNRLAVFHAAGLLMGINLGPLLAQVAFHRPDLIITALTGVICAIL